MKIQISDGIKEWKISQIELHIENPGMLFPRYKSNFHNKVMEHWSYDNDLAFMSFTWLFFKVVIRFKGKK